MSYSRISITIPEHLLIAADRRAQELDRPRSWVVAEALLLAGYFIFSTPKTAGLSLASAPDFLPSSGFGS